MVEYLLAKQDVGGSSPPLRSNSYYEQPHHILIKSYYLRVLGSLATFLISYLLTKRADLSLGIAGIDFFGKIALYYLHDRVWSVILAKKTKKPKKVKV